MIDATSAFGGQVKTRISYAPINYVGDLKGNMIAVSLSIGMWLMHVDILD